MLIQIEGILSAPECAAIRDAVDNPALWRDGRGTAKGEARAAKANLQADPDAPAVKGAVSKIIEALRSHPVFSAAAQPQAFVRAGLNKYGAGMRYGDHVDAPYINNQRTDLSFTLFLGAPETYEGGELVIDNAGHEDRIKGPEGSLVLYPSTAVHRVEEVKAGERLCCFGWVKSRVRSAEERSLLFELETVIADLRECGTPLPVFNRLLNIRNNLLRSFGD